jgi:hypothetical protein
VNKHLLAVLTTSLLIAGIPSLISAHSLNIPLHATAKVDSRCAIAAIQPLAFDAYDPSKAHGWLSTQGNVTASCTLGTFVRILLKGPNPSFLYPFGGAGISDRLWFTLSASGVGSNISSGITRPLTVKVTAMLHPSQDVPAGTYLDHGDNFVVFNF